MAADFNAGSIEGTLELNNAPFKAGLAEARLQAAEFEGKKVTPKADLNKAEFDAKKTEAQVGLDKLGHEKAEPSVGLNISDFLAKYAILHKVLNPGGLSGDGKGIFGLSLGTAKIVSMIGGIMGLVAAAGPATGVLAAFGTAGAAAFGGIAVSMGLFAAATKSAFGEITKANKAGVTLTGWAGTAQKALASLSTAWHALIASSKTGVFRDIALAMNMLAGILPKLAPLLHVTALGVGDILQHINALTHTKLFDHFLSSLEKFMGGFLHGAGPVISNMLKTFMGLFIQLQPLMAVLGHGIERASAAVANFATGKGLHQFVGYVTAEGPKVFALLSGIVHALLHLGKGLAPLAGPALAFLTALVHTIGHIHLGPLSQGFGDLFTSLEPLLPILGHLLNVLLKPIGQLMSAIAHGPIAQLTHGLKGELRPAFHALSQILHSLVKPLSDFAGSIANLANPTGVHLVTALLQGLRGAVHTLAPAMSKLLVALEGVIDNGIETIIPLIPTLTSVLGGLANALVPVVNLLAAILAHRAVADVILGVAGAVYVGVKAFELIRAVTTAATFVQAAYATAMLGSAAATDAGGLSLVIYAARLVILKPLQIAAAAATDILTASSAALGVAIDFALGPVGLIIIGLTALAAGLIYAYKHSKTFRDIVNGAFTEVKHIAGNVLHWFSSAISNTVDFVKAHWQLLLGIITGPIGAAVIFLIAHWAQIKNGFSNLMSDVTNLVDTGVSKVYNFFAGLPGKIVGLVGQMVNAGKALMGGIFHGLESAATAVGGFAANIARSIWNELKSVLNSILPHSLPIHIGPVHKTIPLFPYLAKGGVTDGPMTANIGDNPGGKEAVVPLDKYDIPKRGEVAQIAAGAHADNAKIISLLSIMVQYLAKGTDHEALAQALGGVLDKNSDAQTRRMIQAARAA